MWFGKGAETEGSGGHGRDSRGEDWRGKRVFFFLIFIGEIVFEIMRCGLIGFFFHIHAD